MRDVSIIVPYYRQPAMLRAQLAEWEEFPAGVKFVVVDDGSPEPALDVVMAHSSDALRDRLKLYRIVKDIPWNRGCARNLGARIAADTDWIVQMDIDHILSASAAVDLMMFEPEPGRWYRFPRYRVGAADETRNKDDLPRDCTFGRIKPHIDSYLVERDYFQKWFYDEDFSGCLGGGSPFLQQLEANRGAPIILPDSIFLSVHTRNSIPDSSEHSLSRDTSEYSRRRKDKEARGDTIPRDPVRTPWQRLL